MVPGSPQLGPFLCLILISHLSLRSLHISPEAKFNPSHAEQPHGFPGPAKQPGHVYLGKVVPKLVQTIGQVRGYTLCTNGQLLQVLRRDIPPDPEPDLAMGAAKANAVGPFGGHAVCDNG